MFKNAWAIAIRVEATRQTRAQRGTLVGENDITEIGLDDIKDWDYVIDNNNDYETLKTEVSNMLESIKQDF